MNPDELRDRLVLLVRQAAEVMVDDDWELEAQLVLAVAPGLPCLCCGTRHRLEVLCLPCREATCNVKHSRAHGCKRNKETN